MLVHQKLLSQARISVKCFQAARLFFGCLKTRFCGVRIAHQIAKSLKKWGVRPHNLHENKNMKQIQSPQNETLKSLAKLLDSAKERRKHRLAVLEGSHLLETFLQQNQQPEQVFVPESRWHESETQNLLGRLPEHKITLLATSALSKINSLTHGEVLTSVFRLPENPSPAHVGDCVVLERVQDAGNLGTILRSAAAAGVGRVILSRDCVDVWSPKVLRAAMGAHFLLQIHEDVDLLAWRKTYRGRVLITALNAQSQSLYHLNLKENETGNAWIFGNEGAGVSPELLAQADVCVHIPMLGATESLNVAMAASVCLFEQMRQRIV